MRAFSADRRGSVAVVFALSSVVLVAATGAAVDYSSAYSVRTALQDALDAATLAAVIVGSDDYFHPAADSERQSEGRTVFAANYDLRFDASASFVVVDDVVRGAAETVMPTSFLGIIGINSLTIRVEAAAIRTVGPPICMLSLSMDAVYGVDIQGTTSLHAVNCAVHSNSNSASALNADGGGTGIALGFCSRGGYEGDNWSPEPRARCRVVEDPFEGLAVPDDMSCDRNNAGFQNGTFVLSPGVYCGGITVRANAYLELEPGVYVIKDGPLTLMAQSSFVGTGVTIYFYGTDAVLDHRSGSVINVTAPTSGDYGGIAFAQHAGSSAGTTSTLAGGPDVRVVGSLYFPTQTLDLRGGSDYAALSSYMPMVADRFIIRGNAEMTVEVDLVAAAAVGYDNALAHDVDRPRLIE